MENGIDNQAFDKSPTNSNRSLRVTHSSEIEVATAEPEPVKDDFVVSLNGSTDILCKFEKNSAKLVPAVQEPHAAVSVRNAHKSYQKGVPILKDFNMTVPIGTIYSLLGSSGCGKTSLLSCCVGVRNLDKGEILVFGHKPGTKESGVPGSRVGYMPQELSLYNELTIQELLNFYGRIYGMERAKMLESTAFLIDFLDLPKATRRVGSLSGGQKRRVSIATALLHGPELLVLDEPTVGVDPLLRESIWGYLVKLVKGGGTTVIITTHYVEEARQSDVIGIMRNGRLLAEKSPEALISEFKVNHLEDIVLQLCRMDREEKKKNRGEGGEDISACKPFGTLTKRGMNNLVEDGNVVGLRYESTTQRKSIEGKTAIKCFNKINAEDKSEVAQKTEDIETDCKKGDSDSSKVQLPQPAMSHDSIPFHHSTPTRRLAALLIKNFIILMRNVGFLLFIFLVPAIQVVLICLTIGSDPKGLLIGVVNPESCDFVSPNWRNISSTCPFKNGKEGDRNDSMSCFFLSMLPVESFILEKEESEHTALQRIQSGYTYGYVQFPHDYTDNIRCRYGSRLLGCTKTNDEIFAGSNIILEFDMSNKQIGQTMKRIFVDTYSRTTDQIKVNCHPKKGNMNNNYDLSGAGDIPYTFKKPVYGKDDTSFREFLAPSILLGLLFFFPLCSSGVSYITEKKTGTLDRALVAGVGATELMGGFLISQVGILLGQAGFAFLILTQVFHIEIMGSVSLALSLTILVGISGMSAGFLIAMFCTEEVQAVLLAIGTFFPNILLAGMVWPLEGMERGLQYVSYLLPCTLACESMRSIISRGWTIGHRSVWPGFASTFAWIVAYWILAVIIHRVKSKG